MFCRGQAAIFLHAVDELRDELGDFLRIFAERARVDDGIVGIVVDVGIRRVNPVDADGARFERGDFSHGVGIFGIACGGQRHRGRKRCAFVQTHRGAAFEIGADEQRKF